MGANGRNRGKGAFVCVWEGLAHAPKRICGGFACAKSGFGPEPPDMSFGGGPGPVLERRRQCDATRGLCLVRHTPYPMGVGGGSEANNKVCAHVDQQDFVSQGEGGGMMSAFRFCPLVDLRKWDGAD